MLNSHLSIWYHLDISRRHLCQQPQLEILIVPCYRSGIGVFCCCAVNASVATHSSLAWVDRCQLSESIQEILAACQIEKAWVICKRDKIQFTKQYHLRWFVWQVCLMLDNELRDMQAAWHNSLSCQMQQYILCWTIVVVWWHYLRLQHAWVFHEIQLKWVFDRSYFNLLGWCIRY